jgi:UPF0755 protein
LKGPGVRRYLRPTLIALGAVVVVAGATSAALWARYVAPGPSAAPITLVIERGATLNRISRLLADGGVVSSVFVFRFGTRIEGVHGRLKAGEYSFPPGMTPREVAALMASGRTVIRRLTVPEGLTTTQVVSLVQSADGLEGEVGAAPAEGELLPQTYFYSWGDARKAMIERQKKAMGETLAELWAARTPDLPLRNVGEALTLASIVEKETSKPEERPRVAAVFLNRLRKNMKLQADPTVIYGLSNGKGALDRQLSRADLEAKHRWNTYVIDGLPATPIANPGRASLLAVLNPIKSEELYFVADGTGGHLFAKTLDDHNKNVAKLRDLERERTTPAAAPPAVK